MENITQSIRNLYRPTDVELQHILLDRIVHNYNDPRIPVLNIYDYEPSELPNYGLRTNDQEWCFICPRNGANRLTRNGYWKITGKGSKIKYRKEEIGTKRILVFYLGRTPNGKSKDWKMHEYVVPTNIQSSNQQETFVLCKVIDRSNGGGKSPGYESDSNGIPCDDAYDHIGFNSFYYGGTSQFPTTENRGTCDGSTQQPGVDQNYAVPSPFSVWKMETEQCLNNVLKNWELKSGL